MTDIKAQVLDIIQKLENGCFYEDDIERDVESSPELMSGFDYLEDVLDIEWKLNSDRSFKGARLLVAFGGPNIYIDTAKNTVEGYWWNESYTDSYVEDAMDLHGTLEEMFAC